MHDSHCRQQRNRQQFLRPMIPMVPDVCIRFDDNRTTTADMINKTSGGKSTYEYKLNGDEMSDVDKRQTLGNTLIVN